MYVTSHKKPFVPVSVGGIRLLCNVEAEDKVSGLWEIMLMSSLQQGRQVMS